MHPNCNGVMSSIMDKVNDAVLKNVCGQVTTNMLVTNTVQIYVYTCIYNMVSLE